MKIELDGEFIRMQPDSISWEPPRQIGISGTGVPIYAPFWACRLGFSKITFLEYQRWESAVNGASHIVSLPHLTSGEMTNFTVFVSHVAIRLDSRDPEFAAATGADITLTRIQVT